MSRASTLIIALRLSTNCWFLGNNVMFRGRKMRTRIGMMRSGKNCFSHCAGKEPNGKVLRCC